MCDVINLVGFQSNKAQARWANVGGFSGTVTFSPDTPPHYSITSQSLVVGAVVPCTSGITVFGTP